MKDYNFKSESELVQSTMEILDSICLIQIEKYNPILTDKEIFKRELGIIYYD